jgi:hypothetical protein
MTKNLYATYQPLQKIEVFVPVASLWTEPTPLEPIPNGPLLSADIPTHDSQLLYGEKGIVLEDPDNGWLYIECLEQPAENHSLIASQNCKGWILKKHVHPIDHFIDKPIVIIKPNSHVYEQPNNESHSFAYLPFGCFVLGEKLNHEYWQIHLIDGTRGYIQCNNAKIIKPRLTSIHQLRRKLIKFIELFEGYPYIWGGKSFYTYSPDKITGVDCSGLVHLLYRSCGLIIPRNAHAQFLKATLINPNDLQPGDLIFLQKTTSHKISHVMLFLNDDLFIEATGAPDVNKTRIISFTDYFGIPRTSLTQGMQVTCYDTDFIVHFGSLLSSQEAMLELSINHH